MHEGAYVCATALQFFRVIATKLEQHPAANVQRATTSKHATVRCAAPTLEQRRHTAPTLEQRRGTRCDPASAEVHTPSPTCKTHYVTQHVPCKGQMVKNAFHIRTHFGVP